MTPRAYSRLSHTNHTHISHISHTCSHIEIQAYSTLHQERTADSLAICFILCAACDEQHASKYKSLLQKSGTKGTYILQRDLYFWPIFLSILLIVATPYIHVTHIFLSYTCSQDIEIARIHTIVPEYIATCMNMKDTYTHNMIPIICSNHTNKLVCQTHIAKNHTHCDKSILRQKYIAHVHLHHYDNSFIPL